MDLPSDPLHRIGHRWSLGWGWFLQISSTKKYGKPCRFFLHPILGTFEKCGDDFESKAEHGLVQKWGSDPQCMAMLNWSEWGALFSDKPKTMGIMSTLRTCVDTVTCSLSGSWHIQGHYMVFTLGSSTLGWNEQHHDLFGLLSTSSNHNQKSNIMTFGGWDKGKCILMEFHIDHYRSIYRYSE